jgi:hypothetical protein
MTNEEAILEYLKKVKAATKKEILKMTGVYESGEYIRRLRIRVGRVHPQAAQEGSQNQMLYD